MFERNIKYGSQKMTFERKELDGIEELDRYPRDFSLVIEMDISESQSSNPTNMKSYISPSDPLCLFANNKELEECRELFKCTQRDSFKPKPPPRPECPPPSASSANSRPQSKPDRPPPPPPDMSQSESSRRSPENLLNTESYNHNPPSNGTRANIVNDLLNFSIDESPNAQGGDMSVDHSAPNESQCADLLIDTGNEGARNNQQANSAFDLLNDIFNSGGQQPQQSSSGSMGTENLPKPDLLFASSSANTNANFASNSQPLHRNTSTPNLTKLDPFADLNSFVNNPNTIGETSSSHSSQLPNIPQGIPRVASCSQFQSNAQQSQRPDYNRAHFAENTPNNTGVPKVSGYEFEDLLSDFPKQSKQDSQVKSLAEMKKQELLREGVSEFQLKVNEWKENKKRNIRALLSSLHTVVWEDCNWQPIGLQLLMTHNDVKKMYRKACLAVHPDKVR